MDNSHKKISILITIVLMEILGGAEVDLLVPSFPELIDQFKLSPFEVELTLSVNLIAHCIAALIIGNLGDTFGSRSVILGGLLIFIIGSLCCSFANSFPLIMVGRFLQGVGIAGPVILAYIVISDIYSLKEQQQMMGILSGAITLAMAFAPVAGSYITHLFGWRANFHFLLGFGLLCFMLGLIFIPKKIHTIKPSLAGIFSWRKYAEIMMTAKPLAYIFTICFLSVPFWAFVGVSPILMMDDLGVPLTHFGFYQGALAITISIVSFTSAPIIKKFGAASCVRFGMIILVLFTLSTLVLTIMSATNTAVQSPIIITLNMLLLSVGLILPINILYPIALESYPNAKGKISALIMSTRLIMTAISIQGITLFYSHNFVSIGVGLIILMGLCFLSYGMLKKCDLQNEIAASSS